MHPAGTQNPSTKTHLHFFNLLFISLLCFPAWGLQAKDTLILGVHPYITAQQIIKKFTPLADYLGSALNKTVDIHVAKDYAAHIESIKQEQIDIAYMGPSLYVELSAHQDNPLLARLEINGKSTFKGALIMGAQHHFQQLGDLKGKSFAFGSPHSTMSHLVPRYQLHQAGVTTKDLATHEFLGNHDNVALSVLMGEFDAGAVKEAVYFKYQAQGLKLLQWTPDISEHLFVARKTLPASEVEALRTALHTLSKQPQAALILQSIKKTVTGLVPVEPEDYANLRDILNTLKQQGIPE